MKTKKSMMLPPTWKTAGFIIAAITLASVLCFALIPRLHNLIDQETYKAIDEYSLSLLIISLFVAAMSRDNFEDEMLWQVRMASIFYAFCWVTLYVALYPLLAHFVRIPMIHAQTAILIMLLMYHMNFVASKLIIRRGK